LLKTQTSSAASRCDWSILAVAKLAYTTETLNFC
jgi:hypothetical protein